MAFRLPVLLALVVLAVVAPAASAAPVLNGTYDVPNTPHDLVEGPDGNVWVVVGDALAQFTPSGVRTDFPLVGVNDAKGITVGPDGNLWVTAGTKLIKVPPAAPATQQAFTINDIINANGIVTGPDGNLWTASADKVLRIPPANPTSPTLFTLTSSGTPTAKGIAVAGGALWVADRADLVSGAIVRVTTSGVQTPFAVGGGPQAVGGAPDGTVLFANPGATPQTIGRIAPGGQPVTTEVPQTDPFGIAYGPDGAFWVAQFATGKVARVAADGTITTVTVSAANDPREIAAGPNHTLWVSLELSKKVARITGVDPPPAPVTPTAPTGGAAPADTVAPQLSGLAVSPAAFRTGARPGALRLAASRPPATVRLTLSEPATVRFSAQRLLPGRRGPSGRCVAPSRANRGRAGCVRRVTQGGTVPLALPAGTSRIGFAGRLARVLAPGSYRLSATPTDAAGNVGTARSAGFRVLAPKRR